MTTDALGELHRWATTTPDAPAMGAIGQRPLTFAELDEQINRIAQGLIAEGFRPGDRMLFSIRPGVESVLMVFGTLAADGTIVFVDPGVGPELFARRIDLVAPTWAATESLLHLVSGPLARIGRARGLSLPRFARLPVRHLHSGRRLPGTPWSSINVRQLRRSETGALPTRMPDDEALIVFTSGTTETPKAVVHTHGSLGAGMGSTSGRTTLGPGAHLLTEQLMIGLPALMAGARWSLPPYPLLSTHVDPIAFTRAIVDDASATHAFYTPADLAVALTAMERGELTPPRHLDQIAMGGAPVTTAILRRIEKQLPDTEVLAIYGMTEIVPVAIATGRAKLDHAGPGDLLGEPVPGVVATIAEDGELLLAGPNKCAGFLGEPPLDVVHSGDLAHFDGPNLVLTGRKKDMMIRGKTNIYPGLYEPAIVGIDGVAEAVMVGVPDEVGDERIVLCVVPNQGVSGLAARLRAELPQLIDHDVLPDDIIEMERIPTRGRTNKPDRAALRALVAG